MTMSVWLSTPTGLPASSTTGAALNPLSTRKATASLRTAVSRIEIGFRVIRSAAVAASRTNRFRAVFAILGMGPLQSNGATLVSGTDAALHCRGLCLQARQPPGQAIRSLRDQRPDIAELLFQSSELLLQGGQSACAPRGPSRLVGPRQSWQCSVHIRVLSFAPRFLRHPACREQQ